MPITISIPDSLRAGVEAASGGEQTVLYTISGQPTFMNIVPQFSGANVGVAGYTDPHPMFYGQDGTAKSEYFFGTYPGVVKNGELLSLPGVDVSHTLNHDQFVVYARACGTGHHVVTNAAYAGIALWCRMNSFAPNGNTNWGASSDATWESGRRVDGLAPGTASGTGRTLTGSGPASWRHQNSNSGISDLCGNVWEWSPGVRVNAGEIQVLRNDGSSTVPKNDGVINTIDMSAGSSKWWAIDGTAATVAACFVAPGSANTVKYATSGTTAQTLVQSSGSPFEGMVSYVTGAGAVMTLKVLGLMPVASLLGGTIATPAANSDGFWIDVTGERLPFRLGFWNCSASCGLGTLYASYARSNAYPHIGGRSGFVT
jgi:hypothetical protein